MDGLGELLDGYVRRRDVRVPEAEVDDITTGTARLQLQLVDLGEDVRRKSLNPAKLHHPTLALNLCGLASRLRTRLE